MDTKVEVAENYGRKILEVVRIHSHDLCYLKNLWILYKF